MIDIVKAVAELEESLKAGTLTPSEYAQNLYALAAARADQVQATYTLIVMCDGQVITHQKELTLADLTDAVECYKCQPGMMGHTRPEGCPSDELLSALSANGAASVIDRERDNFCGTDVMTAYVNQ